MYSDNKKTNRSRTFLIVAIAVCACILVCGILVIFNIQSMKGLNYHQTLTVESGDPWPEAKEFVADGDNIQPGAVSYLTDIESIETAVPGTYAVQISYGDKVIDVEIAVYDRVAPIATAKDLTLYNPARVEADEFVAEYTDATDVSIRFEAEPDLTLIGSREVVILLEDLGGNITRLTANLTILNDKQAPEIIGAKDIETYVEDTVAYRSGITVTDDQDAAPILKVDSSAVDLSTPGVYQVTYTATDHVGNTASKTVSIKVYPKKANHVDPEVIYAEADRILAQFITEDMTLREKAGAIYCWTKTNVQYSGKTDKDDWLQAAYQTMKTHKGDCYAFFAVNKLFLHRMGIDTIDVEKVKNHEKDTRHYWLLVSIDGGENYYHYDNAWSWDLCLVTDARLDSFSAMMNNCFNRDKSLYPATPTESLPSVELPWGDPAIKNAK